MGLFPERGAMADAMQPTTPRFSWVDALDEAVLICDRGGGPIAANAAYSDLTFMALLGQSDSVGPRFGRPDLQRCAWASLLRFSVLSKAAKAGDARREILPAMTLGTNALPVQYEATVSPLKRRARGLAFAPHYRFRASDRRR